MPPLKKSFQTGLAAVAARYPSSEQPLAQPPAGSDLKPVRGDFGIPLLGHTLEALADPLGSTMERYERFGPVSWSGSLGLKIVQLVSPTAIEAAWMNRDRAFSSEQGWEPMIGPFFRRGIMLMDFDEHMSHRRILQQAFNRPRLLAYLDIMNPRIEATLANWQVGQDFPIYTRSKEMLLSVANEVFMGIELGDEAAELGEAFEAAVRGGQAIIRADVKYGTWARGLRGRERLQAFFRSEIASRRTEPGDDLFSVLCHSESEEGETFTDEDIVNHMIFAMMAAHDTSSIAVSMMTYFLGRHPEWQERLRAESLALGKDTLEYDDLDALPSLDLAFKETLRYNAPVGMLFRKAIKDTEVDGYFIPKGTLVAINPWATMKLAEWWPNATRWDPERFAPDRREDKVHRFAWAPFGGGAHKCIGLYFGGMEVKAIMHQMLQRFEWTVPHGYFPEMTYGTGPTPADGLPVNITRRG
ncbi:putative cytochrome P450 [Gordonia effusa NBRC 100432]|uniref:Putative cytochrome P450 n=1 Tax=Gordonia effusa NBRC 100432 TaxID=1077974 RepID=H0R044_9ACTN|nr:cytochrome P450 [Gordonia effusa]GAB18445.1 putative cytochrome P450 [Gordonia effusa NBRC 100432]